jgi:hypothetical protein
MSDSLSPRSTAILNAIAITCAIAFISGHVQLTAQSPQSRATQQVQLSTQR